LDQRLVPKTRKDINKHTYHNHLLDNKIVLADAHILLATLQILEDQRVKGLINLRKGWKIYKKTLSTVKDAHDPGVTSSLKFGSGLFYFVISQIPPGLPQVNFIYYI
jgi:hypothetical protein